ncbi:endolytic transglycosylase MltG [Candidatus Uhrbacteria bacterium]|nr:endolytic transglycosylase MltG [Candidatus Uhrbacteria bacterium]
MNSIFRLFVGVLVIALLIAGAFSYLFFAPQSSDTSSIRYIVNQGDSVDDIARGLAVNGVIMNDAIFYLVWRFEGGKLIQAGTYTIPKSTSMYGVYRLFVGGPDRKETTIRFIEGWTTQQIAEYLASIDLVTVDEFSKAVRQNWSNEYPFLAGLPTNDPLEGYLFPDTYRVFEDAESASIIRKVLGTFGEKMTENMRREAQSQGYTIHQIVTLASIIEKEVTSEQDRRMVSDIFRRRIAQGMPLQADSTINFITGKKDPQAKSVDLAIDSLYNTYKYKGLPPGPIGNPGLSSLKAALYPIKNDFLFFLTDAKGNVYYSKTFDEHKKKKLQYL